ncbi:MAG: 3'-5' exonuclease [Deltaproteobacteria bacterium]|nr:3'-5' exonuclease [Deltaproteobacteria bacterium]
MSSQFRYLVYDIETCIDKALLNKVLYAGQGLTDQQAYEAQVAERLTEGSTFINPSFHVPVCIAAIGLNPDFEILKIGLLGKEPKGPRGLAEHFWETYNQNRPVLIDFNGKGFDLRVLELWAFRLGITIRESHYDKFGPRYRFNEEHHLDLHEFLTNYGAIRWKGGLNLFSKILGKPGKMDTKGDMVQELFEAGDLFRIEDYCLGDAMDTYFVFLRTRVLRGVLDLGRERLLVEAAKEAMEKRRAEEGYFTHYLEAFTFWDAESQDLPFPAKK